MNLNKIRKDFPLLNQERSGKPYIYFDNACNTLRPNSVISAVSEYYQKFPTCGERSVYKLAETVTNKFGETRKLMAKFINAGRKEEIIFTRNTTEGINLLANSLALRAGDVVLATDKEHNSNLVPWQVLAKKKGIVRKIVPSNEDNTFNLEKFRAMMDERVKLVAMIYTSNLDGVSTPVEEVINIAHQFGAKVLLDVAQAAAHKKIDVRKLDVDFIAFSGHKMLGPSGTGVFYGKYECLEKLEPFMVGGDTVEYTTYDDFKLLTPPAKFEAGLQNYAGIIGLGEAIKYLGKIGFKNIAQQEYELNKYLTEELLDIPNLSIIGPLDPKLRSGIISFNIKGVDPHKIAIMLDAAANIMIRSGQHCVHSWFKSRNIIGSARISLYFYNTREEAKIFVSNLKNILKVI